MFKVYRVSGNSMLPTLSEGDYVVAFSRFITRFLALKIGTLVVVDHPVLGVCIKRICSVSSSSIELVGDNSTESTSTQVLGHISKESVLGVVVYLSKQI